MRNQRRHDTWVNPSGHLGRGLWDAPGGKVWFKIAGDGPGLLCWWSTADPASPTITSRRSHNSPTIVLSSSGINSVAGRSERPDDTSLWTLERSLDEVDAVLSQLQLEEFHLFGNSWGGMLAQQYALDRSRPPRSLTLSNSLASIPRLAADTARLQQALPQRTRNAIRHHQERGYFACPEYQAAIAEWFRMFICRLDPWPDELEQTFARVGASIYETMIGPSEFHIVGNLKDWDIFPRLGELELPTLPLAGRYDECTPAGSQFVLFENSAHLPMLEEQREFMSILRAFLRSHD